MTKVSVTLVIAVILGITSGTEIVYITAAIVLVLLFLSILRTCLTKSEQTSITASQKYLIFGVVGGLSRRGAVRCSRQTRVVLL